VPEPGDSAPGSGYGPGEILAGLLECRNAADIKLQKTLFKHCKVAWQIIILAASGVDSAARHGRGNPMALDTQAPIMTYDAPKKDLYEIGEIPPLGHVPAKMYAWAIRRERHGAPGRRDAA
jgi:hypothetical protein